MNEVTRLSELAHVCRRIADDQQDPNVLDNRLLFGAKRHQYVTVDSSRVHESASRSERETRRRETSTRSSSRRMSSIV